VRSGAEKKTAGCVGIAPQRGKLRQPSATRWVSPSTHTPSSVRATQTGQLIGSSDRPRAEGAVARRTSTICLTEVSVTANSAPLPSNAGRPLYSYLLCVMNCWVLPPRRGKPRQPSATRWVLAVHTPPSPERATQTGQLIGSSERSRADPAFAGQGRSGAEKTSRPACRLKPGVHPSQPWKLCCLWKCWLYSFRWSGWASQPA
jgi:hypothetical protein